MNEKPDMQDNEAFEEWIYENITLADAIARVPNLLVDLFEEFNNDWIDYCESFDDGSEDEEEEEEPSID